MSADRDLSASIWVRSSYSTSAGGECLEWAPADVAAHGVVPVRDSKAPGGPVLSFPLPGWAGFVAALKRGEL